jgi:Peptidase family M49
MRSFLIATATAALLIGCSPSEPEKTLESTVEQPHNMSELQARYDKIATVDLTGTDTSFLNEEQRQVVNLLIEAAAYMDEIYLRQVSRANPQVRADITASDHAEKELMLKMFDRHFGPWDTLDEDHPFWGDTGKPKGGGFYPTDITKEEFAAWIETHPEDAEAFNSWYTIISRKDDGLVAEPYSKVYAEFLNPAAAKLREAGRLTSNPSLKKFLFLRAKAFLDDDYYASEMAWMSLKDTPIEVVIGPYEVYTDKLYNTKTAFEAFITVKNPKESAALAKYKNWLVDMEKNLPVGESYKNFKRGFESPIAVTYQIHGGGDNVPGVQTIAFNLPNDERVREAKGAKKVLLNNVLGAKFDLILEPMAEQVLVAEQSKMLVKKYMSFETLFHELAHSLGPGKIVVDGKQTEVRAELQELYSTIEEGKADVMGAYNILYMMQRGELPVSEKQAFLATYFTGIFRATRWGTDEAHGGGAAYQYSYFKEVGAVSWNEAEGRFRIDFAKLEQAISDLTGIVVVLEGDGNYDNAKAFLDKYRNLDAHAKKVIAATSHLPTDIAPIYPDKI